MPHLSSQGPLNIEQIILCLHMVNGTSDGKDLSRIWLHQNGHSSISCVTCVNRCGLRIWAHYHGNWSERLRKSQISSRAPLSDKVGLWRNRAAHQTVLSQSSLRYDNGNIGSHHSKMDSSRKQHSDRRDCWFIKILNTYSIDVIIYREIFVSLSDAEIHTQSI